MKKTLIFLVSFLFISSISNATNISGGIYSNTTWTKANSPYIISGNLVIFDNVTLTVEPGVEVLFDSLAKIELRGKLVAIGTTTDSISFKGTQSKENWWKGIKAVCSSVGSGAQITINHCYFAYASLVFDLDYAYQSPYTFKNSTFYKNTEINKDDPIGITIIDNCLFLENNKGPYCGGDDGTVYVTNSWFIGNVEGLHGGNVDKCVFIGNTGYGAYMYQTITNSYFYNNKIGIKADHHHDTKIQYNEIHDNEVGIEIDRMWQDPNIVLRNNKICNNTTWNIQYDYSNSVDISYNCWCTNDSATIRSKIRDGYMNTQYGLLNFTAWDNCELTTPPPMEIPKQYIENSSIIAYPNPATNILTVEFKGNASMNASLTVTDLIGKVVYRSSVLTNKHTINIGHWPVGVYLVKYFDDNKSSTIKMVKE